MWIWSETLIIYDNVKIKIYNIFVSVIELGLIDTWMEIAPVEGRVCPYTQLDLKL